MTKSPKSMMGFLAQARLVPLLLDHDDGIILQESTVKFIRQFATDICDCLDQIMATGLHADPAAFERASAADLTRIPA